MLVYGVNEDILARFDFADVRLPAQEVITEVARLGGIALPCHPGRPNVGLCAHYETQAAARGRGRRRGAERRQQEGRGRRASQELIAPARLPRASAAATRTW